MYAFCKDEIEEVKAAMKRLQNRLDTPPKDCKGIWEGQACPLNAIAEEGREYCSHCWNVGEDLMHEAEAEKLAMSEELEPDDPDDSAGGFEYPHLSDDDISYCDDF